MMIDRAGVALVADLLGGPQAGQGGADHDDGRVGVLGSLMGGIVGPSRPAQLPNMVIHCSGVRRRKT